MRRSPSLPAAAGLHLVDARDDNAPAVEIGGLHKRFGRVSALSGVDLIVPPGRVTAVLGPNGAGKSTLIKCVLGLVRPDAGRIRVQGLPVNGDCGYRAHIGYMPQQARFPENLNGREVLDLVQHLRDTPTPPDRALLRDFGLDADLEKPVRALSGGMRQKLNAAIAFLFRPSLLVLDEPTAGLDPIASGVLKQRILAARLDGVAVMITSHVLSELDELVDDVVFLLEGRIHFHGPIRRLRETTGESRLERAIARLMRGGVA